MNKENVNEMVQEKEVTNQEVVFTLEGVAGEVLKKLLHANRRINAKVEEVKEVFALYDTFNALPYDVESVQVGNKTFDLGQYNIPTFLKDYVLPKAVTFSGEESDPDMLLRKAIDVDNLQVSLTPSAINDVLNELCSYLRLQVDSFVRKDVIAFQQVTIESLAINDVYSSRGGDLDKITFQVNGNLVNVNVIAPRAQRNYVVENMQETLLLKLDTALQQRGKTVAPKPDPTPAS